MAKLVEILARELEVWPVFSKSGVFSDDGIIAYFEIEAGRKGAALLTPEDSVELPKGFQRVTRAEWQAAVDALNEPAVVEWDGVGLPPVGLPVEWCSDNSAGWQEIVVLAYHRFDAWIQPKGKASMIVGNIDNFRPIRTPEQIAAEKEFAEIKELAMATGLRARDGQMEVARALYKAGYRKQEPK